ncbi:MAG TPA: hypothetical protein VJG32_17030 [Anaerolineae bacterium]|nr:hypothetical protein [Anaerolineae bacterium]
MASAGVALIVLVLLAHWGGSTTTGPLFALGIAVLSVLILAFSALVWWLYLSPLPAQVGRPVERSAQVRQALAALVVISGVLFTIGAFWDEVWHRRYGINLNDFLWPPHLMIYGSMGLTSLFAGGGLFFALSGSGDLRQRFRAEPRLGLLGLVSLYILASVPSDLLWHEIYGLDISAWSLPHVLLVGGFTLVMLIGISLQLSLAPPRPWSGLRGLSGREFLALVLSVLAALLLTQFGATEWDNIAAIDPGQNTAFWNRPEWLYPVVVIVVALFIGNFVLHTIRRAGAATLVGLLVLGVRLILLASFGAGDVGLGFFSHLLLLPPLIALDVWYALRLRYAEEQATHVGGSLIAGVVFLAIGLPAIAGSLVYPRVTGETLPGMIGFGLAAAIAAGGIGARMGNWLRALDQPAEETIPISPRVAWIGLGMVAVTLALVAVFVVTARPPV